MNVPYFAVNQAPELLKRTWLSSIEEFIDSGVFIAGPVVDKFEEEWNKQINASFSVGVSNGLDGLKIALKVLGISKGMRVVVPAHTFIATWLAIQAVGATPIGLDTNHNGLIDLNYLDEIDGQVDAIIPVHMHGAMVDMPRLMSWANNHGVKVIEDASQAHGAILDGKYAGTWGDSGVFSLYPTKNLGALGDAGIMVFKDEKLSLRAKSLRSYGTRLGHKYDYQEIGMNCRLDPIQASILLVNCRFLEEWNAKRIELGCIYDKYLDQTITRLQPTENNSVRHHFPILVSNVAEVKMFLNSKNIETDRHYPKTAASIYENLSGRKNQAKFPISEIIAESSLSLPISPWHTMAQINYVIENINLGVSQGLIKPKSFSL
jgi:dTDP-4-amino-4,6-dideoxygalactose transaminase